MVGKHEWLACHAGGTIGRVRGKELVYAAKVGGVELARAYGDTMKLTDAVGVAEAEGHCPLDPLGVGTTA